MRIQRHGNRGTTKSRDVQVGQRSNSRGNMGWRYMCIGGDTFALSSMEASMPRY